MGKKSSSSDAAGKTDDTEAKLLAHASYFDRVLAMIPAKFYIVEKSQEVADPRWTKYSQNPSAKSKRKEDAKEASKKAKRIRLDPSQPQTVPEQQKQEMLKRQARRDAGQDSSSEDEEDDDEGDDGMDDSEDDTDAEGAYRKPNRPVMKPVDVPNVVVDGTIEDLRKRLQERIEAARKRRGLAPGESGAAAGANSNTDRTATANKRKKAKQAKEEKQQRLSSKDAKGILVSSPRIVDGVDAHTGEKTLVYSKFDFSQAKSHEKTKKKLTPAQLLMKVEAQKKKMAELSEKDAGKAKEVSEKQAWRKAIQKAEGERVLDDASLIKKTIKRIEKKKEKSRVGWNERKKTVQKAEQERIAKREANLKARIEAKKSGKPAGKGFGKGGKGRPGFEGGAKKSKGGRKST